MVVDDVAISKRKMVNFAQNLGWLAKNPDLTH
jgi:hypothetical protein